VSAPEGREPTPIPPFPQEGTQAEIDAWVEGMGKAIEQMRERLRSGEWPPPSPHTRNTGPIVLHMDPELAD
jgi:hypothetical protein